MNKSKSALAAFLLSFIPGVGHAYLGRPVRFLLYAGSFFGALGLLALLMITNSIDDGIGFFLLFVAAISAIVNMIDMIISLISGKVPSLTTNYSSHYGAAASMDEADPASGYGRLHPHYLTQEQQQEKTRVILLSFLPGIGHMSMGLMQRGITYLIAFIGLFAIIVFLSVIMSSGVILIFLLALPVIWIYCMFDAIQLLHAKQRGEALEDRSMFEELESHITSGRKNKVLAIALSIFPGAGHLYLGLQKRGLQLMAGFLFAIYVMDSMRLSLFLFLLPLFWCFAFFDALQQTSRYEREELTDEPLISQLVPYQRWFGIALLGFGVYYLLDRVAIELIAKYWREFHYQYTQIKYMFPTALVAFIMIVVGLRLAFGSKSHAGVRGASQPVRRTDREGGA